MFNITKKLYFIYRKRCYHQSEQWVNAILRMLQLEFCNIFISCTALLLMLGNVAGVVANGNLSLVPSTTLMSMGSEEQDKVTTMPAIITTSGSSIDNSNKTNNTAKSDASKTKGFDSIKEQTNNLNVSGNIFWLIYYIWKWTINL